MLIIWEFVSIYIFQEFEPEDLGKLIETLKQLATDSTKSRSKKDRKEQRYGDKNIWKYT